MESIINNYNMWSSILLLAFFRPLGIFVIMPVLSSKNLGGGGIRNGLIFLVSIPVLPTLFAHKTDFLLDESHLWQLILLWVNEFITGILIGFCAAIAFWAVDAGCYIIDTMRGSSMATALNPALGESSTIFGVFFSQLLAVIFFAFGGFEHLLTGLYQSYQLFPPGSVWHFDKKFLSFFIHQWDMLFTLMFNFAIPAIGIMLMVDLGLGLLNRAAQQLNIFFLAMPIKSALVLLLLIITLSHSLSHIQDYVKHIDILLKDLWRISLEW